ncbi:MAG TPA: hypothetical protein PKV72_00815 [Candidatus Peribacteria bacterium]|nr:hypothetical protein [Candidatus Peribacteria bacterium]
MLNAPRSAISEAPRGGTPLGLSRRKFLTQSALMALLCGALPGDNRVERREKLTPGQILRLLQEEGIAGARSVEARVVPENPAHVFLHIPQYHSGLFMDREAQRAVRASQADIERILLDLQKRFGVQEVYPENMVPKNLAENERFSMRDDPEKEFLDAIAFQRKLMEDARGRNTPEEHIREMEHIGTRNIAEFERELAQVRRLGKDGYNRMRFEKMQRADAEFDAPLRLELAGRMRRRLCGTDAALTRAGQMREQHGLKHRAVTDDRENDAIATVLSQTVDPLLAVPYGAAHDFTNNIAEHNQRQPGRALALVVAEPLSHAIIPLRTE